MTKRFTNAFLEKFPQYVPPGLEEVYAPKPEVFEAVKKAVAARRAPTTAVEPEAPIEDPAMTAPAPAAPADDDLEARLAERKQELLDAQGMRDDRTFGANLFEAAGQMAQGASGAEGAYDGSFYGKLRDQATQGVTDVGAKQKLLADEQGAIAKERETKRTSALGDPRSTQSMVARNVARRRIQESGGDPSMIPDTMSALDAADMERSITGLESSATRRQTAAEAAAGRANALKIAQMNRDTVREQHNREQSEKRMTPLGEATTEQDAKDLKDGIEAKKRFDQHINEMIALREKHGAEAWNREAVSRGKQLSKDLLLEYKNMAKLGVLSKSDEDIINAIIPDDPLEFKTAQLVGQDPIMSNLKKFKADKDSDFQTKLQTRLRNPGAADMSVMAPSTGGQFPRKVRKGSKSGIVSNENELREAMAEGFN